MSKPQHAQDPSVEDMLSTIRKAIDEETARTARESAQPASVSGSMREMRVSLQPPGSPSGGERHAVESPDVAPPRGSRPEFADSARPHPAGPGGSEPALSAPQATTRVSSPGRPFSGIMGGDVRLEEALARLQRAERRQDPVQARPAHGHPHEQLSRPAVQPSSDTAYAGGFIRSPDQVRATNTTGTAPELPARPELGGFAAQPRPAAQAQQPTPAHQPAAPMNAPAGSYPATSRPGSTGPAPIPVRSVRRDDSQSFSQTGQAADPARQVDAPAQRREPCPPSSQPRNVLAEVSAPSLLSHEAEQAATKAFARLSEEMLMRSMGGSETLTNAARDMLRPMLKAWLDENLPSLVERLVREEIERVVRRGGH